MRPLWLFAALLFAIAAAACFAVAGTSSEPLALHLVLSVVLLGACLAVMVVGFLRRPPAASLIEARNTGPKMVAAVVSVAFGALASVAATCAVSCLDRDWGLLGMLFAVPFAAIFAVLCAVFARLAYRPATRASASLPHAIARPTRDRRG